MGASAGTPTSAATSAYPNKPIQVPEVPKQVMPVHRFPTLLPSEPAVEGEGSLQAGDAEGDDGEVGWDTVAGKAAAGPAKDHRPDCSFYSLPPLRSSSTKVHPLDGQAVDRVLLADADGQDTRVVMSMSAYTSRNRRVGLCWTSILHAGQAGQVTGDMALAEPLASHAAMGQVIECEPGSSHRISAVRAQCREIIRNIGVPAR